MKTNYHENRFARYWLCEGVLFFEYKPETVLNLQTAKRVVTARLKLQGENTYPVLFDIRGITMVEKEARDYLLRKGTTQVKAMGLLSDNFAIRATAALYLKMCPSPVPAKVFKNQDKALKFLKKFT